MSRGRGISELFDGQRGIEFERFQAISRAFTRRVKSIACLGAGVPEKSKTFWGKAAMDGLRE